jgi:hypothetical protein
MRLLTIAEASQRLALAPSTIRRLIREGCSLAFAPQARGPSGFPIRPVKGGLRASAP